jgi:hypothetical protein
MMPFKGLQHPGQICHLDLTLLLMLQVHPVEIIVNDDVPKVSAVSVSSIDASMYSFQGAKEMYAHFEGTINKTLTAKQEFKRT